MGIAESILSKTEGLNPSYESTNLVAKYAWVSARGASTHSTNLRPIEEL